MNNSFFDSMIDNPLMDQEKQLLEINKKISIKFKARNMKKGLTTIYGLESLGYDNKTMNSIASSIKKKLGCASYVKSIEGNNVIEIQGDKKVEAKNILINEYSVPVHKVSVL